MRTFCPDSCIQLTMTVHPLMHHILHSPWLLTNLAWHTLSRLSTLLCLCLSIFRCSWGGTPVSFQWKGTSCVKDSKPYRVLYASNSQGPPGTPNCRCANMQTVTPPTAPGYSWSYNADIQGKDLAADGNKFYKICAPGNPAAIAAKCNEPHKGGKCVAFTWDGNCGYLKYANGPTTFKTGWYTYKKNTATTGH